MNILKYAALLFTVVGSLSQAHGAQLEGTYGVHLFFNETEFVDVMTITRDLKSGQLTGDMQVPDDFNGALDSIVETKKGFDFDLFVPKNNSRPTDLIFHYVVECFDAKCEQIVGFTTIKGESNFVASFVGFKRVQ